MRVCNEYEVLIQLALDDLLSPEDRQKLTDHLDNCPACRTYYAELYAMKQALAQMDEPVPEELHQRILNHIEQYRSEEEKKDTKKVIPFRNRRWYRTAAGIAACAVFAVAAARFVPDLNVSGTTDAAAPVAPGAVNSTASQIEYVIDTTDGAEAYKPSTEAVTAPAESAAPRPAPMPEAPAAEAAPPELFNNDFTGQMAEDLPPLRKENMDEDMDYRVTTVAKWLKVTGNRDALPDWVDRHFIYETELDGSSREYVEIAAWAEDYWTDQLVACGFTVEELLDHDTVEDGEHILLIFFWE